MNTDTLGIKLPTFEISGDTEDSGHNIMWKWRQIGEIYLQEKKAKIAGNHRKLGEKYRTASPLIPGKATDTAHTLTSDSGFPN
jgi:hypothetical protein